MEKKREKGDKIEPKMSPAGYRNCANLLEYLSNPDNDWPKRSDYSQKVLGYKRDTQIYKSLTPQDLTEIEGLALENRKKRSARQRGMVLEALFKKAIGFTVRDTKLFKTGDDRIISQEIDKHYPPDPVAGREFLDRTEGKVRDVQRVEHSFDDLNDSEIDEKISELLKGNPDLFDKLAALVQEGNL